MSSVDALLHPVRLRIVMQLAAVEGPLSAKDLSGRLSDVPHATLYRHVRALADAGWLTPAEARPARGAVEVRYALARGQAVATAEDVAEASLEDHRRWFGAFVATLLGAFGRYTDTPEAEPVSDRVRYRLVPLQLDDVQTQAFHDDLDALLERYRSYQGGRSRQFAFATLPDPDGSSSS